MRRRFGEIVRRSIRAYASTPSIAHLYDRYYENTPLLEYDTDFLADVLTPGRVLDIGCGTGRHLLDLSRRGFECVGMDLSAHMTDLARVKLEAAGLTARLVRADMARPLPFADGSFENVICMFSTIGLVPGAAARDAFLGEVRRVLVPGGVFALHVHNRLYNVYSPWGRRWLLKTYIWDRLFTDLEVGDRVMEEYRGIKNMYLHVFSLSEVTGLLRRGGFEIRRLSYLNDSRNGEVAPGRFASVKANGFLIAAAAPGA